MLKNYLLIAFRHLVKHKGFSVINILGLAVGMACSLFILLWVRDELSFDRFHDHASRTYRVNLNLLDNDIKAAVVCAPLAQTAQQQIPAVEQAIRLNLFNADLLQVEDRVFDEQRICYADSNFFDFFTFPLIEGDPKKALAMPESIVLTREMAIKYFGSTNILGKTIRKSNKNQEFVVTGVLETIPANSHLQLDFIEPMSFLARTHQDLIQNKWDNFGWYTYLRLRDDADVSEAGISNLNDQLSAIYHANEPHMMLKFFLQPMTAIHLTPGLLVDVSGGDIQYVYIFGIVSAIVLAVACINFMNMSTARSARRAREVGLRKVVGAVRGQLIGQFLCESILIALASLVIALMFVTALAPAFSTLTGKTIQLRFQDGNLWLGMTAITLLTGLVAGSYPALVLSRFIPAVVMKGKDGSGVSGTFFRNALVVAQFSAAVMLLAGTVIIFDQMEFIRHRNIGYDKENLLYIPMNGNLGADIQRLKTMLETDPATKDYAIVSALPTNMANGTIDVKWDGKQPDAQPLFPNMAVDENFIDVFKMELLAGRAFSRDVRADSANYLVNERALQVMGMTPENAVGQRISMFSVSGTIVGVVKNFNFKPVQTSVEPMIIQFNPGYGNVVVRIRPGEMEQAIAGLKKITQALNPQYPFTYNFVDQDLNKMYQSEERLGKLFRIFAGLGLLISCLGLYGLSAFLAERRKQEIGVRKVLGASVFSITYLLSGTFARPILLSMAIATPLSWYVMDQWLDTFAYRVDIGWSVFLFAFVTCALIALATVSYETVRAALMNPTRALRGE